ncbi:TIGR01212 family radical SAM protein [Malaciobacter molluscorum LMG 25693]|uniref:TIGR01212 family radical SAM protein n=1 Tax=Malaciobacter molluscorum LMG 25693 TaxID=870501 RepID=A0A2G1DFZ3_9BACT|nr:TIGR01212 family radical SAM protein [Malaciobacter molluscorum]AXX91702.1 TIGR01212 family radical SAM protein [Malaciobacter molluscorum LMG 25693]PHO17409.1 TIGR01212 family radical SAM protein [Malaciobacter molluscorum LMG 25693]
MQEAPYFTFKAYMKNIYNTALHTIPIDLDLGCPNRTKDGIGGCTFCPENGARAAQLLDAKDVEQQIKNAISFSKNRYNANEFMLYIQAYTGTFTSVINQKQIYSKLLNLYKFKAISIGTRPDCLNTKTLEYLQELNEQIDVYIDLGIQTLNDSTLKDINRGHDSKCSIEAIKKIKKYNLKVFAHIIVGFENETREDWLNTVQNIVKQKVDGIKIHNLHIIKNTQLHKQFENRAFKVYNEYEYADELIFLIRNIPKEIPIIRTSTDTSSNDLVAPIWHMQKGQFVEYINETMFYQGYAQGDLLDKQTIDLKKQNSFKLEDNSVTIWDKTYKDFYHPKSGAYTQADELFIKQSKLEEKLQKNDLNILDIGFGMGYNSLAIIKLPKEKKVNITALDKNRIIIKHSSNLNNNSDEKKILDSIFETLKYEDSNNSLQLLLGDARFTITKLEKKYDIVFLDAFLPNLNPSLLTYNFFILLKVVLNKDAIIICSQNNSIIKAGFAKAGFIYEDFNINRTDIKALIIKQGSNTTKNRYYEDPFLIYREKQIVTNFEKNI